MWIHAPPAATRLFGVVGLVLTLAAALAPAASSADARTPDTGVTPLEPDEATPPPPPEVRGLPDRKTTWMVRWHFMFGPQWRIRDVDPVLATGVEYGKMHGLSGAAHLTFVPPRRAQLFEDDPEVAVTEGSLGVGLVLRGRTRNRQLYGSIGLLAGMRVHRAKTEDGLVHRLDPDLTLPIQGAWTIKTVGLSVALVQGYSFRSREYESRGEILWSRPAYRVGLLLGLHVDVPTRGISVDRKVSRGHNRRR